MQTDDDPKNTVKEIEEFLMATNFYFPSQSYFSATGQYLNYWRQNWEEKDEKQVENEVKANLAF